MTKPERNPKHEARKLRCGVPVCYLVFELLSSFVIPSCAVIQISLVESRDNGFTPSQMITKLHLDFCVHRQVHVRPRAELNQADALCPRASIACLRLRDDPAGAHPDA